MIPFVPLALYLAIAGCDWQSAHASGAKLIIGGIDQAFDWRRPFSPEPWWPVGARLFHYFDHSILYASGRDVPDLVANVERAMKRAGYSQLARVEVWTHGAPGWFRIQRKPQFAKLFIQPSAAQRSALEQLRARLAPGAAVHFRSCSSFRGPLGRDLAAGASAFFNATGRAISVMGHTRPTGLTHPAWKTLGPGRRPNWPDADGSSEAALEGSWILVRDLLRFATGDALEWVQQLRERLARDDGATAIFAIHHLPMLSRLISAPDRASELRVRSRAKKPTR